VNLFIDRHGRAGLLSLFALIPECEHLTWQEKQPPKKEAPPGTPAEGAAARYAEITIVQVRSAHCSQHDWIYARRCGQGRQDLSPLLLYSHKTVFWWFSGKDGLWFWFSNIVQKRFAPSVPTTRVKTEP
jgi:hypothetical protein